MREGGAGLGLRDVLQEGARGRDRKRLVVAAEAGEGGDTEVLQQERACVRVVNGGIGDRFEDGRGEAEDGAQALGLALRDENLLRLDPEQFVAQRVRPGGAQFQHAKFGGRQVQPGEAYAGRAGRERGQVVRLARGQQIGFDQRAGRVEAHDLTPDEALRRPGVLHLIAQGHRAARPQQLGDVAGGGVIGQPAQRHLVGLVLVAGGQGDVEQARAFDGVLVEHFVEVADPEKQNRVRVLLLDLAVLPHERREIRGHPHPRHGRATA